MCKNGSSLPKHCDPAMDKVQHKNKSKCYFKYKDAEKIGRNLAYSERVDEVINALKVSNSLREDLSRKLTVCRTQP